MKKCYAIMLISLISTSVIISCASKNPTESKPVFNSFQEEVEYIIESNFTFGAVAAGIIKGDEQFTIFHGTKSKNSNVPPDENTMYEIGSITKTFTATILADFVVNGTVGLDDEVQDYLPADSVTIPSYNGSNITFWHLATHTSALPTNFSDNYPLPAGSPADDPFALMTANHVYDYFTHYVTLTRVPGSQYEYSNFGYGFLGFVLGRINNSSYEPLLKTKILDVLDMDNTSIRVNDEQMNNIAVGHDKMKNEVGLMASSHVLVGAGNIKSTLKNMMAYLKANMGFLDTRLNEAMALAHQPQFENYVCLGWFLETLSDGQIIISKGGATAGYITFIGFNSSRSTGVVILYNWTATLLPIEVGMRIFEIAGKY